MNITVTLKGKQGTGKSTLAKAMKEALESMGFVCSKCHPNDAHNSEHFIIQAPRDRVKQLKGKL